MRACKQLSRLSLCKGKEVIGKGTNLIKKENLRVCISQGKGSGGKGQVGGELRRGGRIIEAMRSQTR